MLDIFQSNFDKLVKEKNFSPEELKTVSYTHLTLPTIYSV